MWRDGAVLIPDVRAEVSQPLVLAHRRANLHWKHQIQGEASCSGKGLKIAGMLRFPC